MTGKKAVHFGAGNIGRGFVAEFLHKSGYEVVFADVMAPLIESLQAKSSYTVTEIGVEGEKTSTITNYRAINSKTHEADVITEISEADIVTCAVGPNILKFIAPVIAAGIDGRKLDYPLVVIACENMIGATDTLHGFIKEKVTDKDTYSKHAIFGNSAIDRIVPEQDKDAGLNVKLESFYEWVVDTTGFGSYGPPKIDGVKFVDNLEPFIERKLYTVNTGHAAAAYWGYALKKAYVDEALSDDAIVKEVHGALEETKKLITLKHTHISEAEQEAYVKKIITRISNPYLKDRVERVGRAPLRKLGRKERFIGPASQLAERGVPSPALLRCVEQTLKFQNVEGDDESFELAKKLESLTPEEAVTQITGIEKEHPLYKQLMPIFEKAQSKSKV